MGRNAHVPAYALVIILALTFNCHGEQPVPHINGKDGAGVQDTAHLEKATFGGGCFWCLEAVFERIPGVKSVMPGYAGGTVANPTYEQVCTGTTGHAEVIQIEFDTAVVSYDKLLETFWECHDPTTLNRQGPDVGTQYRSVIFYGDAKQKTEAESSKAALAASGTYPDPIVTDVVPLDHFYRAEDYHRDYYNNHSNAPYCVFVIRPKLDKLHLK